MKKTLIQFLDLSRLPIESHLRQALHRANVAPHRPSLVVFRPDALWSWFLSYARFLFRPRHAFLTAADAPNKTSVYQIPDQLKVSLAGDWGTGTDESALVAKQMMSWDDGKPADITLHLGDVYYVGGKHEVIQNCLGGQGGRFPGDLCVTWPVGALGSFALNGNHEMYANGAAYFDLFLPALGWRRADGGMPGQGPSFFCLENRHWRIIGLDTGYNSTRAPIVSLFLADAALPDELVDWLKQQRETWQEPKGIILLAHHQPFSAFQENYPRPAAQLGELFPERVLFFWGHEHRFAGYHPQEVEGLKFIGRCVGHGGMPVEAEPPKYGEASLRFYDRRVNPAYSNDGIGYNGFAQLHFDGPSLEVSYQSLELADGKALPYSDKARLLVSEMFMVQDGVIQDSDPVAVLPPLGLCEEKPA